MTSTATGSLREVQKLDERIREIRKALTVYDERLIEVEGPALALETELSQATDRLSQMNADVRRLERAADDKRARAEKMDQRLNRVSNLREEAAVHTEVDLLRRAIDADEHEAMQLIDGIRRIEQTVEQLTENAKTARAGVEPRQRALRADRTAYAERMELLLGRRTEVLAHVGAQERRVYEAFHGSGRMVVVTALLDDGACGHCFGVIPLQLQNEVRRSTTLIRCENCGVILTTEPEPALIDLEGGLELPSMDAPEAGAEDGLAEGAPEGADAGASEAS